MSAHTPGPWSVQNVEYGAEITDDLCILGPSPDFRDVATVLRCFQGDRIPAMEAANARLIAAAPELLAALKTALRVMNNECDPDEYSAPLSIVHAAIAKATGEPA